MKLTINYVLFFSLLVYLKLNDSKGNDLLKLGSCIVIAYLIYQLFKGKSVEGWNDASPGCDSILYIGSPTNPSMTDQINAISSPPFDDPDTKILLGGGCNLGNMVGHARVMPQRAFLKTVRNFETIGIKRAVSNDLLDTGLTSDTVPDYRVYCSNDIETNEGCGVTGAPDGANAGVPVVATDAASDAGSDAADAAGAAQELSDVEFGDHVEPAVNRQPGFRRGDS